MPITFRQIAANTATYTGNIDGYDVTLVYYPGRITEKVIAKAQNFGTGVTGVESLLAEATQLNQLVITLVQSWDVYDDEAQTIMYPLTQDKLGDLPISFRIGVVIAIIGDLRPNLTPPQDVAPIPS